MEKQTPPPVDTKPVVTTCELHLYRMADGNVQMKFQGAEVDVMGLLAFGKMMVEQKVLKTLTYETQPLVGAQSDR